MVDLSTINLNPTFEAGGVVQIRYKSCNQGFYILIGYAVGLALSVCIVYYYSMDNSKKEEYHGEEQS